MYSMRQLIRIVESKLFEADTTDWPNIIAGLVSNLPREIQSEVFNAKEHATASAEELTAFVPDARYSIYYAIATALEGHGFQESNRVTGNLTSPQAQASYQNYVASVQQIVKLVSQGQTAAPQPQPAAQTTSARM